MTPVACGTPTGYRKHWRRGEQACQACRDARVYRGGTKKPCRYCSARTERQDRVCAFCAKTPRSSDVELTGGEWVWRGGIARWVAAEEVVA